MKTFVTGLSIALCTLTCALACAATPSPQASQKAADQALLKRIYQARIQLERERQGADNEARNNSPLVRAGAVRANAAPGLTQMRQDMATQLARFEQNFRCLDVDVNNTGGNTVVICGGNSGNISGENTSAGGDMITVPDMQR